MSGPLPTFGTPLSERERGVLLSVADGARIGAIADELELAYSTVDKHLINVRAKLGARTNAHAVALAYHRGILVPMERAA